MRISDWSSDLCASDLWRTSPRSPTTPRPPSASMTRTVAWVALSSTWTSPTPWAGSRTRVFPDTETTDQHRNRTTSRCSEGHGAVHRGALLRRIHLSVERCGWAVADAKPPLQVLLLRRGP